MMVSVSRQEGGDAIAFAQAYDYLVTEREIDPRLVRSLHEKKIISSR